MSLRRLFDFSPQAKFWGRLAFYMFILGLFAAAGNGFGMQKFVEGGLFALGFFVLPFTALLLGLAAFSEEYHLPRVTLWAGVAGLLATGSLAASLTLGLSTEGGNISASVFWSVCCFPVLLVVLAVGVYFIGKAWGEARDEMAKGRQARALAFIQAHGEVTLAELSAALHLPEAQSAALVQTLEENRLLFGGLFDAPRGRVYSPEALQAKFQQLTNLAKAQGVVRLDDLAVELRAPRELLRSWICQLARDRKLTGYLRWEAGLFHVVAAEQLDGAQQCPGCGGGLAAGGEGFAQCRQCGAEILV